MNSTSKNKRPKVFKTNNKDKVNSEKEKTEMCKNYLEFGYCRYSQNVITTCIQCTFAHGNNELRDKVLHDSFKTKPCKNYHKYGSCSYGTRCQYLHSEIKHKVQWWGYLRKQLNKNDVPYTFPWKKDEKAQFNNRLDVMRFQRVCEITEQQQQLPYFKNLCN